MQTRFPKSGGPTGVPGKVKETEVKPASTTTTVDKTAPKVLEQKTAFTGQAVHSTVEKPTANGHVVPLSSRSKADPLIGARETSTRVSEKIPTPTRPPGYSPRALWQEIVVMGTGHDEARALIGRKDLVEKLEGIGFDASVATEWRDFFAGIDRVSTERGNPNPSARGRAEFADWVVVQLGGTSSGLWKGAAA